MCPWYDSFRYQFLETLPPSDHEFLKHQLACTPKMLELYRLFPHILLVHFDAGMFVVASSNADPMTEFNSLTQLQHEQQHQHPNKLPKWFCPNILRYYVLLHDPATCDQKR